jgi:hypothetical protein
MWKLRVPEGEDNYNRKLEAAVKAIEDLVRPHLGEQKEVLADFCPKIDRLRAAQ